MAGIFGHIRFGVPDLPATATATTTASFDGDTSAVWDPRGQTLRLTCDRLGSNPLYYHLTGDGVLFASRPEAILAHVDPVLDLDGLRKALAFTLSVPGVPWSGISGVAPGTTTTVTPSGVRTETYWRLTAREHTDDLATTVANIRDLLTDAVRSRPVRAALLSGGLDSSLLTALAGTRLHTYDVDFTGYEDHFTADDERAAPDAPYAAEAAAHLGTLHRTVGLTPAALADPDLRRTVVRAYGIPPGWGDRDRSAYLLYRSVREDFPGALSGEAADELFGGYAVFFDPVIHRARTFPWVATGYTTYGPVSEALRPELRLDLPGHLAGEYARSVSEVECLDGEDEGERRMRTVAHLYLTRALPVLLTRKDRLSRAAGLDVRLPFADHRLVEYVYNVPWSMKTFDGREKSLLRAAARGLLPPSVLGRLKTAFPSIRHPAYSAALARQAAELAAEAGHAVFAIADRSWLGAVGRRDARSMPARTRNTLEWILNLAAWLELYRPTLRLP
ncbi:asparagine synthetase B family protein [Planomonospora venezuelensis]|uniref:asparagine synthase (glutamine-hydrolyzing) n=1 Tax=Planomonospora venezuelensis TaxID=1999 RepID=A0A841DE71_PLAVE|nr:asparagine synthase-related protein [Planomonospora venezuelensis]MBB5967073.1 asparagine synthase (glutamine-hydrolyzing) [Planomonospora venezuelensis]GIN04913.1 asparagine synthetase B [Planomonospora venezuelensis]